MENTGVKKGHDDKKLPLHIVHVITGLQTGGAEMMLYKLLSEVSEDQNVRSRVVSLMQDGPIGKRIRNLGVPVTTLDMPRGTLTWDGLYRLFQLLRQEQPDVVQTWMYHADLIGGIVAWMAGVDHIVWNIRSSTLDPDRDKSTTIWTAKLCAWLSSWLPDRIVTCAREAGRVHAELGYDASKMVVVPNGFDTKQYRPDEQRRAQIRDELNLQNEAVVGLVARYHPQKDHRTFVRAAALFLERVPDAHFVLCGTDVTWENQELVGWIEEHGLRDSFSLLGRRDDVASVMTAFDVAVLSSATGEAFPNVVGEAMACGVPCVVTRVGDSAEIIGDTGIAVPTESPVELAEGCEKILSKSVDERKELGRKARDRIKRLYSLEATGEKYLDVYETVSGHP
ncbi:glycosyltransferase family 4 protein [Salinibacter ruber]|uniref:glycosyltransferase family 4 protein n=1 Tax=Salinibacter ruber TaxID=146919 RepID=UPI002166DBFF|nr:glycosyltransferase [Salinibacter ruber]MCS4174784.1 glycosyltransferase involved in cell wall biosynthesis [Salinibacter ruber]